MLSSKQIKTLIKLALQEDLGSGDITTDCTVPQNLKLTGRFIAKSNGVIAGLGLATHVFQYLDPEIKAVYHFREGDAVTEGDLIGTVQGPGRAILSGERVALNFMQRMSGIATMASQFVEAVKGTSATILDTRKTVPGLRLLDKWAVRIGGAKNHRFGLYDMALIKENHIVAAGGISAAVDLLRKKYARSRRIEVEVKNLIELEEALKLEVEMIMLDNFSLADMRRAVTITKGRVSLEASGNVSLETVREIALTGVNFISSGMLTHSVKALDISLLIENKEQEAF